ncbi:hypothetical protein BT69DRAFT_1328939 [Atractiella rhizophila]|nr:hypothetical protein BT69DRAFT_1328939 [Atractiella rhizophila]
MEDVSGVLGAYLLKGWTMSDELCSREDCPGIPLMQRGTESFCARCDGPPSPQTAVAAPLARVTTPSSPTTDSFSTNSTGLTSNATAEDFQMPVVDPQTQLMRRQQSDVASQRIGELLLKGWTLLGEECTNSTCWGVPLMGYPRHMNTNGRRLCVICRREYVDGNATPEATGTSSAAPSRSTGVGPAERQVDAMTDVGRTVGVGAGPTKQDRKQKGKARKYDLSSRMPPPPISSNPIVPPPRSPRPSLTNTIVPAQSPIPPPAIDPQMNYDGHTKAVSSLNRKLAQLADSLDGTSELERIRELAATIGTCGEALGRLRSSA